MQAHEMAGKAQATPGGDSSGGRADRHGKFVRLSVNLSLETSEIFKALIARKGMSITEGVRRGIAVWKFVEDERDRGNEIAVIEADGTVRKVVLL